MMYLGDFVSQATVDFMWSSNNASGASVTRATNGTISVYKGNSTTQTTTGVTDTEDFDSLTGIHHCRIATTDAFYATANNYTVVLSGATIDGQTVNAVLATFSIENRYNPTPPTAAAIADAVWDEDAEGHLTAGTFGSNLEAAAIDPWGTIMTDYTDADTAGKILNDIAGSSGATPADIADAVWDEATADHVAAGSAGLAMAYARDGSLVYGSTTAANNLRKAFDGSGSYTASTLTIGAVTDVTNVVDANLTGINSDAATWAAALAIWKSGVPGTVASGSNTSTVVTTDLPSAATGRYIGKTLVVLSGSRAGEGGKLVTAYNGTTKELTVETMTGALTVGDTFVLLG